MLIEPPGKVTLSYLLIPLDIFLESQHNISNRLDAWLMLIASDRPEQILKVIRAYPEFEEIYRQVFGFRRQVKELMNMFSDALKILDANTTKYMIEQQREEIERQNEKIEKQNEEIAQRNEEIAQLKEANKNQEEALLSKEKEIERLKARLAAEKTIDL